MIHSSKSPGQPGLPNDPTDSSQGAAWQHLFVALAVLLVLAAVSVGCGNESDNTGAETSEPAGPSAANISTGAPNASDQVQSKMLDLPKDAAPSAIVEELNFELRRWVVRNRRMPASFEEFTSTAQIQVPPPPPGKKYVLTKQMKVELADR